MRRREFITMLGGAAAASSVSWPLAARAQQAGKLPTIGFLGASTLSNWSPWTAAFVQRMRELGWTEGRTVAIEYRWAEGRNERFTEIAAEFVRLKVDIILTGGVAVAAVKQATSVIPIVCDTVADGLACGRRTLAGCWAKATEAAHAVMRTTNIEMRLVEIIFGISSRRNVARIM